MAAGLTTQAGLKKWQKASPAAEKRRREATPLALGGKKKKSAWPLPFPALARPSLLVGLPRGEAVKAAPTPPPV